jgi:hypothetical protein
MYTLPPDFGPVGLVGKPQPAEHFQLESIFSDAQDFFEMHDCILQKGPVCINIYYPAGTTRQMYCPVVTEERWQVLLPDGTEIEESHGRTLKMNQIMYSFPETRPEEKQINHSAVAQLRDDIDAEIRSMQMCRQFTPTARHDAITAKANNIGLITDKLAKHVGRRLADQITCETYMQVMSQ